MEISPRLKLFRSICFYKLMLLRAGHCCWYRFWFQFNYYVLCKEYLQRLRLYSYRGRTNLVERSPTVLPNFCASFLNSLISDFSGVARWRAGENWSWGDSVGDWMESRKFVEGGLCIVNREVILIISPPQSSYTLSVRRMGRASARTSGRSVASRLYKVG
jgi:hypothetical protein